MRRNVALALLTLTELEQLKDQRLVPENLSAALGNLFLPGRYQRLLRNPDFIFDTAHNEQALSGALAHFCRREISGRRIVFFGCMHNKELEKLPGKIVQGFDLILAAPVSIPRSRNAEELQTLLRAWDIETQPLAEGWPDAPAGLVAPDMQAGLDWLARNLKKEDRVLVTGSCFMVAEVLHKLGFENLEMTREEVEAGPVLARRVQSA